MKTFDSIRTHLQNTAEKLLKNKMTGVLKHIFDAISSMFLAHDLRWEFIEKQCFVPTADADYLELQYGILYPRNKAKKAVGTVAFFGTKQAEVPVETEIQDDDGLLYITTASISISEFSINTEIKIDGEFAYINLDEVLAPKVHGPIYLYSNQENTTPREASINKDLNRLQFDKEGTEGGLDENGKEVARQGTIYRYLATVPVVAVEAGLSYNKAENDVLETKTIINNVDLVARVISIASGADDEDTEIYRSRILARLRNPGVRFSKAGLSIYLQETLGLQFCTTIPGRPATGQLTILACDTNYKLEDNLKEDIQKLVYREMPANLQESDIFVQSPNIVDITVKIKHKAVIIPELQEEIEKNLDTFFKKNIFAKNVTKKELELIVYDSKYGLERSTDFEIEEGWKLDVASTELLKLVDVEQDNA